jgi:adenylate cyclase
MGRIRRALQQRLPVAAGAATLTVFLVAVILLPKTTSEVLRDSAFDIELAVAAAAQDHHRRRQPGPPP